ncbi:MAG: DNA polymerase III subunit gamma/tau [Mycoplasmoidaceae bacterium]
MNKTLYRKYKPDNFSSIIGQFYIKKILLNSLENNMISHAYIFSGPRGVGKTSIARIFAKSINCTNRINGDACCVCKNCKLFSSSDCMDIIELDAASNNGVNEIRNLIDSTKFIPNIFSKKVYIIDESHMLTNSSWNALLKTLEDPPKDVVFIFATTEVNKIPLTILSRCQRFDFEKIGKDVLKQFIHNIIRLENIKILPDAIDEIISISDGSVRDCLSILNQTQSYSNNEITSNDIREIFGLLDTKSKINLIKLIINNDILNISVIINKYELKGVNFYKLCFQLIEILLDKLFYIKSGSFDNLKILNEENIDSFELSEKQLLDLIEILQNGIIQIKNNIDDKFFFELVALNCVSYLNKNESNVKKEIIMGNKPIKNINLSKTNIDSTIDNEVQKNSPKIISNISTEELVCSNVKFENVVTSRKLENNFVQKDIFQQVNDKPYSLKEVKIDSIIKPKNISEDKEEKNNTLFKESSKKENLILAELDKNLVSLFSEIAFNNNNEIKNKLNLVFDNIRGTVPRNPEEAYIIDASKILIASNNGFVLMYDDELSSINLNLISDNEEFILYIKNRFGSIFKVIGVTRKQAKDFSEFVKELKRNYKVYQDVNIEKLKLKIKANASTKEIALEIFGEEIGK